MDHCSRIMINNFKVAFSFVISNILPTISEYSSNHFNNVNFCLILLKPSKSYIFCNNYCQEAMDQGSYIITIIHQT